jgi:hypothetical protein
VALGERERERERERENLEGAVRNTTFYEREREIEIKF